MQSFSIICLVAFLASCVADPFGECPAVDGENPTYLPDLTENNVFWECNSGIPRRLSCPIGLIHNPNKNVCDFPSTDCEPYGPIGDCPENGNALLRDGLNVAVYWACIKGEPTMGKCKDGLWFKPQYGGACFVPK